MSAENQPDFQPKLYLLHLQEQCDLDIIYGIFDSREKAEAAMYGPQYLISCASITELTLNTIHDRE